MRVSDYIIQFLEKKGVNTIFMLTGGQAMFLNDAVFKSKKIEPIFVHHEQAAGMAAEAYGRISQQLGVAMVTAGPAAINILNGVVGAWVDSSPMMVISGQSAYTNVEYMKQTGIRQCGLQGIYTEPLAKAYTKYFVTIDDPSKTPFYLEQAYELALSGRPGPVWIEVPLDIQRMEVPKKLEIHYVQKKNIDALKPSKQDIDEIVDKILHSKRPLLYVGQGVRHAKAETELLQLIQEWGIPITLARLGLDLIESRSKFFVGRPGLYGDRPANFAIQSADVILAIGARLDPGGIGYDASDWGRGAYKYIIDIDEKELHKPGISNKKTIHADAKIFLQSLMKALNKKTIKPDTRHWIKAISYWKKTYPVVLPEYKQEDPINSYYFTERLSEKASSQDLIIVDTSSPFHVVTQSWNIKKGQRLLTTGGISTMGYWPASIGACLAKGKKRTLVITGDGCFQMNIQELATIRQFQLPIKIFVINNNGYLLIRHTQHTHMEDRLIGESPETGVWFPDFMKVAQAYDIKGVKISHVHELDKKLQEIFAYKGPVLVDVASPFWQPIIPRIASDKRPDGSLVSHPYEDLYPFLSPEELSAALLKAVSD